MGGGCIGAIVGRLMASHTIHDESGHTPDGRGADANDYHLHLSA